MNSPLKASALAPKTAEPVFQEYMGVWYSTEEIIDFFRYHFRPRCTQFLLETSEVFFRSYLEYRGQYGVVHPDRNDLNPYVWVRLSADIERFEENGHLPSFMLAVYHRLRTAV